MYKKMSEYSFIFIYKEVSKKIISGSIAKMAPMENYTWSEFSFFNNSDESLYHVTNEAKRYPNFNIVL